MEAIVIGERLPSSLNLPVRQSARGDRRVWGKRLSRHLRLTVKLSIGLSIIVLLLTVILVIPVQ